MTDLRKAAEMSIEAIMDGDVKDKAAAVYALRQALAQPEQKSFDRLIRIMGTFDLATGHGDTMDELLDSLESELRDVLGNYREALRQALAQPEREQYVTRVVAMHEDGTYTTEQIPLPKREWVGLTDEERADCWSSSAVQSAINIEAKLKEKNSG